MPPWMPQPITDCDVKQCRRFDLAVAPFQAATTCAAPRAPPAVVATEQIPLLVGGSGSTTVAQEPIAIDDLLRRCHELLIAPLELACGEPLLLIPDSDLYALPFAALLSADGKHLIERHSLRVAPSVGTVIELEVRAACRGAAAAPAALVVGNPVYHGWAKQLPAAEAEARRVSETLATSAGFKVCTLTDVDATKPAVVEAMRGCDVIHLATHGEPGSVLLGGATRAEGALSMAEVQGLELSARLVVLSECDSFRGKLTGDGVIGITRAFVVAGALTLVASLWKVEDAATRTLGCWRAARWVTRRRRCRARWCP